MRTYCHDMEGNALTAICRVEGILRAEEFTPDGEFIGLVYGYTEDELARKLAAKPGG